MKVKDETLRVWSWRIFVAWFIFAFMLFCWGLVEGKRKINQCIEKAPDLCYPFFISLRL